jgi:Pyridoxamine 5'-phosphate oxidase
MDESQRQKLAELFAQEHAAVIVTQGEEWPTATLQAFAETPELDLLFIMGETAEKFQNLLRRPKVTVIVDARGVGDVNKFHVSRCVVQGIASEVAKGSRVGFTERHFSKEEPVRAAVLSQSRSADGACETQASFMHRAGQQGIQNRGVS